MLIQSLQHLMCSVLKCLHGELGLDLLF